MTDLRARSFTVSHVTGEKRRVVFLHVAEAAIERLRVVHPEALRGSELERRVLTPGADAREPRP